MIPADWWIRLRDDKRFRQPLRWGFAKHCFHVVEKKLKENRCNGEFPSTWTDFVDGFGVSAGANVFRKRKGDDPTSMVECLGIATLLDLDPQELVPNTSSWLESATIKLCKNSGVDITASEAQEMVMHFVDYFQEHRGQPIPLGALNGGGGSVSNMVERLASTWLEEKT